MSCLFVCLVVWLGVVVVAVVVVVVVAVIVVAGNREREIHLRCAARG